MAGWLVHTSNGNSGFIELPMWVEVSGLHSLNCLHVKLLNQWILIAENNTHSPNFDNRSSMLH